MRERKRQPHSVEAQLFDAPDDGAEVHGHAVGTRRQVAGEGEPRVEAEPGARRRAQFKKSMYSLFGQFLVECACHTLCGPLCQAGGAPAYALEHDAVAFAIRDASGVYGEALADSTRHQHSCHTQVQSFSGSGQMCAAQCLMAVPVEVASDPEQLVSS